MNKVFGVILIIPLVLLLILIVYEGWPVFLALTILIGFLWLANKGYELFTGKK